MSNQWEQVKAAAEQFLASGDISLHGQTALARFALAAIPVVESAEEAVGRIRYGVSREMGSDVVKILDTAIAKLRESE